MGYRGGARAVEAEDPRGEDDGQRGGKHIGRPRKPVDWRKYEELGEKGLSLRDIARVLGVEYSTLRRRIREEYKR